MKTQKFGTIAKGTGFKTLSGEVRRAITRNHSSEDIGQTFIDNFGRTYVYTKQGCIY